MHQRLQMEPVITPTPILSSRTSNTPKDLTTTLIDSNLKQMNLSSSNTTVNKSFPPSFPNANNTSPSFPANVFSTGPNFSINSTNLSMNTVRSPPQTTNLPTSSFSASNPSSLAPAAFFSANYTSPTLSSAISTQSKLPTKQLTFSEINDFLN